MKKIIAQYLQPFYGRMAVGMLIKFIGSIMDLIIPTILARIIDRAIPSGSIPMIFYWGGAMVGCALIGMIFNIIANQMASRVASDAIEVIRNDLFSKIMYLSNRQMDRLTKPSAISRLTTDTYVVHQVIVRIQRLGVRAPIMLIGGIVVTLILDPMLALILIAVIPILVLITFLVSRKSIPLFAALQQSVDGFVRLVREDINGIRVIKALAKTDFEKSRFEAFNARVVNREKKARMLVARIQPLMHVCLNIGLVAVILVGAYGVNQGISEVGKILAFMTYFTIILQAVVAISRMIEMWPKAMASADRIMGVLDDEDEMVMGFDSKTSQADKETMITFENVDFSYNQQEAVLAGINFSVKQGDTLGIIGETGSGKTTLLSLLLRLYDTDQGDIYLDGKNIRSFSQREMHQYFGVVFQNDMLFEATIRENVDLGRMLSEDAIAAAIKAAGASEFVNAKTGKTEEALTIKGANLSGGQKQRILIARALAACPAVLILDDASSALDYKTDAAVRKALKADYDQMTKIIVAQRVSSIRHADQILVLENGRMIGLGSHDELIRNCQVYREISHSQMGVSG